MAAILKGTVNDATSFPSPNAAHGSYHWAFERVLSASLIPVMGAAAVSTGSAYVSYSTLDRTCGGQQGVLGIKETRELGGVDVVSEL